MRNYRESLSRIPGVRSTREGEIIFPGIPWDSWCYFQKVLALPIGQLRGVVLCDLLGWLSWSSETSLLWEFTLPEMTKLVKRWENDNPNGPPQSYGIRRRHQQMMWMKFWVLHGRAEQTNLARKCRCGTAYPTTESNCPDCKKYWSESGRTAVGPRGNRTYNLKLIGHTEQSVAIAAWDSRGQKRLGPDLLQKAWSQTLYHYGA